MLSSEKYSLYYNNPCYFVGHMFFIDDRQLSQRHKIFCMYDFLSIVHIFTLVRLFAYMLEPLFRLISDNFDREKDHGRCDKIFKIRGPTRSPITHTHIHFHTHTQIHSWLGDVFWTHVCLCACVLACVGSSNGRAGLYPVWALNSQLLLNNIGEKSVSTWLHHTC